MRTGGHDRGERREDSPPYDSHGQNTARPQPVCKPSPNRLEECITPQQCAEDASQLNIAQSVRFRDGWPCDRDIYAVEKRNGSEHENPSDQKPTDVCLLGG